MFLPKILQQPQRARACGAGAKSSADRRPVDPPPVIELKIFDGEHDITFQHNASFFLYTTLEAARPIAQPKGSSIPAQHPVLTGTPVAGMAYLDRPCHAGYFIFPDLSVRHEGRYRLSFNLFEEVKMEADMDLVTEDQDHPSSKLLHRSPSNPFQSVHFRLEVKSEPFSVYSAKKFPGLTESTQLSRVVAEQGCRVRIRRDVRIRVRKDTKPSNDDDMTGDATPLDGYATPVSIDHSVVDRARSLNNSSAMGGGIAQQYPAIEAKASSQEQAYVKQSPYMHHVHPHTYQPQHMSFDEPNQQYQIPQSISSQPSYTTAYHQQSSHSRQNSTSSIHEFYAQRRVQYPAPVQTPVQTNTEPASYTVAIDTNPSQPNNSILPPLKSIQPMMVASPTVYEQSTTFSPHSNKRGYGMVFNDRHTGAPVQYGARPETSGEEVPQVETEEYGVMSEDQLAQMKNMLLYKRADGSRHYKRIPMA